METRSTRGQDAYSKPSFSFSNRLARTGWNVTCFLLFRFSPKPLHHWRAFLLRLFGAKIAAKTHIYPKVVIWAPWNLEVGSEAGIADGVILYNQALIKIGERAVISQGAHLCTGSHDYTNSGFPLFATPIQIGNHVWIAAEVFVHPGVLIGDGAVVGARSVVTKDMPAWTVCAGHPCVPIKPRLMKS